MHHLRQKLAHPVRDFVNVRLQCEMSRVEKPDFGVRNVTFERFRARREEIRIMFSPDREQCRFPLSELLMKLRIQLHVVRIIQKQVQLDVLIAQPAEQRRIQRVSHRRQRVGIGDS